MGVRRAYVWRGRVDGVYRRPWVAEISPQDVVDPALPIYARAQGAYDPEAEHFRTHEEAIAWADEQVNGKVRTWRHETRGLIRGWVMAEGRNHLSVRLTEPATLPYVGGRKERGEVLHMLRHRVREIKEN